jgi:hypothetical protein
MLLRKIYYRNRSNVDKEKEFSEQENGFVAKKK